MKSKSKINEQDKQKQIHRYREQINGHPMGGGLRGRQRQVKGIKRYRLPAIKIVIEHTLQHRV